MKEHTFDRSVGDFPGASQPKFDDERTLQSARPVVPLEKINAKVRHRKQWLLGGAFAVAMMLGAASALLASYFQLRNVPASISEVSQEEVMPAPIAAMQPEPSESPVVDSLEEEEAPVSLSEKTEIITPKSRTVAKRLPVQRDVPRLSKEEEEDELDRIRAAVLYDEWQERRARRATRRERRRLERYNHRDLSNLDEIFEGRRRPNP